MASRLCGRLAGLSCVGLCVVSIAQARADALARLKPQRLDAVHKAILDLRAQRQPLRRPGALRDFRANLHVHTRLSHDSRGSIEEIVQAATTVGTRILMFTEHPDARYDYYRDGHCGLRDGVLLFPGAETSGFLAFPRRSLGNFKPGTPQEFADVVRRHGGLIFLSHLEERMDWRIRWLTGTEIYNTHADFKDEKRLHEAMRRPLWILTTIDTFRKYPQEAFSALQDYPADYLRRWDELCAEVPCTGVAANDAHQNAGLVIRLAENGKAGVEDALGKKLFELPVNLVDSLRNLAKGKKTGDIIFQHLLDPYPISLRHVGTRVLLPRLGEKEVWEALEAGRAYVAFDWLGDPEGFDFAACTPERRYEMGSRAPLDRRLKLQAQAPLSVRWKLLRDGKLIREERGRRLEVPVTSAGVYRVEAWLNIAGESMVWVLSNPVYIRAP